MSISRMLALGLAVVVLAIVGWVRFRSKPVDVIVFRAELGTVNKIVTNTRAGTVKACRRSRLAPPAGGQISRLFVKKGDYVKAGQPLLELWNEDSEARLRATREQLRANTQLAHEACARAELAARDAARGKRLRNDQLIAEEEYDRLASNEKTQEAACSAARASVDQVRAEIHAQEATLSRTQLRAPFSGYVAEITGELGEFTTPSPPGIPTPAAIDLIDTACLYVSAPIDEVDAAAVQVGQPADITLDAYRDRRFKGKVRRIAPYVLEVEKQARTVEVEVAFLNPGETERLIVGYSADVEILVEEHAQVLRIPTSAVLRGDKVLVFQPEDRKLVERSITPGLSNFDFMEVRQGLAPGDQVVTSLERPGVVAGATARIQASSTR